MTSDVPEWVVCAVAAAGRHTGLSWLPVLRMNKILGSMYIPEEDRRTSWIAMETRVAWWLYM